MAKRGSNGANPAAPPSSTNGHHQDLAERVGQQVGGFTSRTLRSVFRAVGRIREEAEDVWAEAQALRHREKAEADAAESHRS